MYDGIGILQEWHQEGRFVSLAESNYAGRDTEQMARLMFNGILIVAAKTA